VGGMSVQKQKRMLSTHGGVIVGTPGRLWEVLAEVNIYIYI